MSFLTQLSEWSFSNCQSWVDESDTKVRPVLKVPATIDDRFFRAQASRGRLALCLGS